MAVQTQRVVQGCFVDTFTVKQDTIKVTLKGEKDDIRAGDGDIGDVLKSLELHTTAGEDAPVIAALQMDEVNITTAPYPFVVKDFTVKQDTITIKVEAEKQNLTEDEADDTAADVVKALAVHSVGGSDKPVELTLARADI
jgi:hypothetical protein